MDDRTARLMWQLLEPIHAVTYFAAEARAATKAAGLRGFWMGYFAQRAAPLGAVGPEVATASFYGFAPRRVARALPDAWQYTTPARALVARMDGVDGALRKILGETVDTEVMTRAADLAWDAAMAADTAGRVLAAANQALPRPEDAHLRLWQATTILREHRGDGHNAILITNGICPVEAHVLKSAADEADGEILREGRQWTESEWDEGILALRARGWLDHSDTLTPEGEQAHHQIEAQSDRVAMRPWRTLGAKGTEALAEIARPWATAVVDSGLLTIPNPIGMPWPPVCLS